MSTSYRSRWSITLLILFSLFRSRKSIFLFFTASTWCCLWSFRSLWTILSTCWLSWWLSTSLIIIWSRCRSRSLSWTLVGTSLWWSWRWLLAWLTFFWSFKSIFLFTSTWTYLLNGVIRCLWCILIITRLAWCCSLITITILSSIWSSLGRLGWSSLRWSLLFLTRFTFFWSFEFIFVSPLLLIINHLRYQCHFIVYIDIIFALYKPHIDSKFIKICLFFLEFVLVF